MSTNVIPRHTEKLEGLPYELSYIPDTLKRRAKSELFEDEETRNHSLRLLKSMLEDESGLHWQDDDLFLLSFLRARKFDVKRAFNLMMAFYNVIGKHEELYFNFDFDDVRRTMKENSLGFLPYRDSEGCVILVVRTSTSDPDVNSLADNLRVLTSGLLHSNLSPATQIAGFKVIFDFAGFTLKQALHASPTYQRLFAEALHNCFPGRFRAVHVLNEGYLFWCIWTVMKQLLTKKLRERIHFHGKDVKKLHEYFSPSILPAEYHGALPPFDNTEWSRKMEERADYITHVFSHGFLEHKARAQAKHDNNKSSRKMKYFPLPHSSKSTS